jgi:hypothetical protein
VGRCSGRRAVELAGWAGGGGEPLNLAEFFAVCPTRRRRRPSARAKCKVQIGRANGRATRRPLESGSPASASSLQLSRPPTRQAPRRRSFILADRGEWAAAAAGPSALADWFCLTRAGATLRRPKWRRRRRRPAGLGQPAAAAQKHTAARLANWLRRVSIRGARRPASRPAAHHLRSRLFPLISLIVFATTKTIPANGPSGRR